MREAIENYLLHMKLSNQSENTIRSYRGYLLDFDRQTGEIEPSRLDVQDIERYLLALSHRQLAKASVRRALATVKSFGEWLVGEGLLRENPADAFSGPRQPHRVQRRATEDEILRLINGPVRTSFPERDRLILELLYGSGLRCDEVANIRLDDFTEADVLLVSKGKGNKQRQVLLTDYAQLALKKLYLRKRKQLLRRRSRNGDKRDVTGLFFALNGGQIDALSSRTFIVSWLKSLPMPVCRGSVRMIYAAPSLHTWTSTVPRAL